MPIETRSNSALFRRAEQLKRWEDSETNQESHIVPKNKKCKIKFSDGCVFLAACAASDTEEVERLLKLGTDINTSNVDGLTALHQACIDNNLEMVQFLVEQGCDVNRGDNEGWTPLHATASCGFLSIAKYLIENGANVAAVNNDGDLPIDIAESSDMEEYLSDVLDEKSIDCDLARSEEERLMMEDAKLLNSGIDLVDKIHPRTGATPLHIAAAKGYIDVMRLLIQGGADLNAQDYDGWTPIHAAAHWGQKEVCAVLADNLVNMDIQNFAGQTCFDVADPELVKLLEELKKKQTHMQKDRPDIQAILQRTSNRPPLKRRTSVTRMSGQEKSKSVMKDTKAERAQIESLSLPEEENEDDKGVENQIEKPKNVLKSSNQEITVVKEPVLERIPSWKRVLRRSAENTSNVETDVEVTLKMPKKMCEDNDKSQFNENAVIKEGRVIVNQVRDEESELQRKAHAKRVRETRRSTQGVLLEDIKSAELQFLINTQQEATKRQAEETERENVVDSSIVSEKVMNIDNLSRDKESCKNFNSDSINDSNNSVEVQPLKCAENSKDDQRNFSEESSNKIEKSNSVTLILKSKVTSSPDDASTTENKVSLGTQAAIQRRRRPKRRSTGVVYLDSDDAQEEKESVNDDSQIKTGQIECSRQRYGSSSSVPDSALETPSRSDASCPYSSVSHFNINDEKNKEYQKLYEEMKREKEIAKETLKKTEDELEKTKHQLQKISQNYMKSTLSEAEKKERRSLERRISEMEEEIKLVEKLKADNERLNNENKALIRVISKLSK